MVQRRRRNLITLLEISTAVKASYSNMANKLMNNNQITCFSFKYLRLNLYLTNSLGLIGPNVVFCSYIYIKISKLILDEKYKILFAK